MKKTARTTAVLTGAAGCFAMSAGIAEPLPLWEIGAGIAPIVMPDYRGSDVTKTRVLPIPYLVYRGKFLRADREGLRGLLFAGETLEVNISANATLPASSEDNPARRGMADLRSTVELGPTVDIHLWQSPGRKVKLDFRAPLRTAITVESRPRRIGWVFAPVLDLGLRDPAGLPGWKIGFRAGPIFNDRKYNGYFYSVGPADATERRPAYVAPGGYSGSQVTMTASKRFRRYWAGGFLRYDTVAGAVFDSSPLVKRGGAVSAGIAMAWVFGESPRKVDAEE